jgi:hypothetical protein
LIEQATDVTVPLVVCETANENIHTFTASGAIIERIITNSSVSTPNQISQGGSIYCLGNSSTYNDIYLVWRRGSNNYLEFCQFDNAPQAPQNLNSSASSGDHPQINWRFNNEPDIQEYRVYKRDHPSYGTWQYLGSTTNNYFIDNSETIVVGAHIANEVKKYYCVKAVDISNKISDFSDILGIRVKGNVQFKQTTNDKKNDNEIMEFALFSNYPNPFNPTTTIKYQLSNSEFVNLTVYNSLGQEISVLVNEMQEKGNHSIIFNANDLPSGLYIYRLQSGKFSAVGKMVLTK